MARQGTRAAQKPPLVVPPEVTLTLNTEGKLTFDNVPDASNPWKVLNQAICTLVRIAQGDNAYYAFEASTFLVNYAASEIVRREARKAQSEADRPSRILTPAPDRDAVINELRGLYAKALGPSQLIVDAGTDSKS